MLEESSAVVSLLVKLLKALESCLKEGWVRKGRRSTVVDKNNWVWWVERFREN